MSRYTVDFMTECLNAPRRHIVLIDRNTNRARSICGVISSTGWCSPRNQPPCTTCTELIRRHCEPTEQK